MANEDRCRELPQPGQRQQRLRDQTELSEPPCCLSAESIPTENTSPQTADPKKREELGHRREEGQRAPTEGAQQPPAQGEGPWSPAWRRTPTKGEADRPGGAADDGGEWSAGAVNEVGGEGTQMAGVGEEESRPPSR
jgi:hypothetical protein